jgi:hypothetical protein
VTDLDTSKTSLPSALETKKKSLASKLRGFAAMASIMMIGACGVIPDESQITTTSSSTTTLPLVPWSENLKPEIVVADITKTTCKNLKKAIRTETQLVASRLNASKKPSADAYVSAAYLEKIDWEDTRHFDEVQEVERAVTDPILAASSLKTPTERQYESFLKKSVDDCGLSENSTELDASASELDVMLSQMISSVINLPWYPKGFEEYSNSGVAIKKSTKKGLGCYNCVGLVYEVISSRNCSNQLYVEANIINGYGAVEDWTNDVVRSLRAGVVAYIRLISYTATLPATIEITDVSCN